MKDLFQLIATRIDGLTSTEDRGTAADGLLELAIRAALAAEQMPYTPERAERMLQALQLQMVNAIDDEMRAK